MKERIHDTEYDSFMDEYDRKHELCPKCGSKDHRSTLAGYILDMDNKDKYKDGNRCVCTTCGDNHITHDRISADEFRDRKINTILE